LGVIARGRLLADTTASAFVAANSRTYVRIKAPEPERMRDALAGAGIAVGTAPDGTLEAEGADPARIGELAAAHGLVVHEVAARESSLEEAFMRLTGEAR
ncbi:ABC transporter ATP-binding protein, partial [Actinoallomurus acaciae]